MTEREFDVRDADGCEDFESLEEAGLHPEEEEEAAPEMTEESAEAEESEAAGETEDGEADGESDSEAGEEDPLTAALREANDKYMRLFAEFDNYRKRTAKEKSETYQDAVAKTVLELLPVVDSFSRAMESPCSDEAYQSGMENIYRQLTAFLSKLGVEEIAALGEPFDPKVHNAIRQVEDDSYGESTVCEVYQAGWRLGDRIIRPAMVSVAN